jgi:lipopolysaccharide transport system ATP-binding protein
MYVRLAFAVAAHLEPEILIVDEVLAVGDAQFQKKCLGKMGEVSKHGRTVLFVSHNMSAVRSLCTSCCMLTDGRVAFRGATDVGLAYYMQNISAANGRATVQFDQPALSPWMRSARLTSLGRSADTIKVGDPLELTVEFARPSPMRFPNLVLVMSDANGQLLVQANTRYITPQLQSAGPDGDGIITCDLGVVPLVPGRYFLSLSLGDLFIDTHVVSEAIAFEVVENSIWESGQAPPTNSAPLWWPVKFVVAG